MGMQMNAKKNKYLKDPGGKFMARTLDNKTRIEVELRQLLPNPFVGRFPDIERFYESFDLKHLVENMTRFGLFRDGLVCRSHGENYQIAFGHYRVAAGKIVFGETCITSILVATLSDSEMLQLYAADNMFSEDFDKQHNTVFYAHHLLKLHHADLCKGLPHKPLEHEPGSIRCISAFLGPGWPRIKVQRIGISQSDYY
jgi:hypothetical protein